MEINEARKIIDKVRGSFVTFGGDGLLEGLKLLKSREKTGSSPGYSTGNEVIYAHGFDSVDMSAEDVAQMTKYGWHLDTALNCWSCFV